MVRGKSDKVDARFISKYGWMRKEELQPMSPLSDAQLELQQLMSHLDIPLLLLNKMIENR